MLLDYKTLRLRCKDFLVWQNQPSNGTKWMRSYTAMLIIIQVFFELEYRCPKLQENAPLARFRASFRRAICPNCEERFEPEAGCLVQALYVRGGLNDVA
jgi:hypothetical protein